MTQYARDEFDDIPESTERRGVHRVARPQGSAALKPLLITGALALLLGVIVYFAFPTLGVRAAAPAPATTQSAAATPPAKAKEKAASPSPKPSAAATPKTSGVDRSLTVSVYNGSGVSGLAASYGQKVAAAGWPVGTVSNWAGAPQSSSVVFYSSAASRDAAASLAGSLGIARVELSSQLQEPLVVVLGPGAS